MPDHWKSTTLGDVSMMEMGRTPPRKDAMYWTEDLERPFCTIADMDGRHLSPSREGVTAAAELDGKARRVSAGSLLMSFKLTIGKVAFAARDLFPNEAIVAIYPDECVVSKDFLYLSLGTRDLSDESGQAVMGKTLNKKSLHAIEVLLPTVEEQRRIVDLVSAVDAQIEALEMQAEATRTVRAGVLAELLSGKRLLDESYDRAVGL